MWTKFLIYKDSYKVKFKTKRKHNGLHHYLGSNRVQSCWNQARDLQPTVLKKYQTTKNLQPTMEFDHTTLIKSDYNYIWN
jgi:hypothetical protein